MPVEEEDSRDPLVEIISPEELEQIPEGIRDKVEVLFSHTELIRSPLLPPRLLKQYGEVVPGLERKLVEWTEAETKHRRELEVEGFKEAASLRRRGQNFGLVATSLGLVIAGIVAIAAAIHSSWPAAGAAIVIAVVSVGGPFAARLLASRWSNNSGAEN